MFRRLAFLFRQQFSDYVLERNHTGDIDMSQSSLRSYQIVDMPHGVAPPRLMPQQTFEEARVMGYSLADTAGLRHWSFIDQITGYRYHRPGERHEVTFEPSSLPDIWSSNRPDTPEAMKAFLEERGWEGILVLQLAIHYALSLPDQPIALDEFVRLLFDIRSAKERRQKRVWIWETLCAIFNMRLYGLRYGTYRDPLTKQLLDLEFRGEPLIAPSPGTRSFAHGQQGLWPDDIPVTIGFTMGRWGAEARKNPKVLQRFGDLRVILEIPAGKPSGAWARCILFGLNQRWRECAKQVHSNRHSRIGSDGQERMVIATRWPCAFTRRELLINLFQPASRFSVETMLIGANPQRARYTWNEAIGLLKTNGLISYYQEMVPLDAKRKGWQDDWLNQPLDIRPNAAGKQAAREIATAHASAIRKHRRGSKTKGVTTAALAVRTN